ncbi:hypothetical protein Ptr902_09740 [Pyrenophora tritici-repentis]|uniref:Uncharacterized protein n=1 Tax=Pyrenophora tritici-repentis TaxID=45151 RepID=A0A834RJ98_9PLEO|nr:hypothetical protein PtrM4_044070 [Pyrenophora tritici-repentis]KAI0608363.1 hypothetical protein TUN205_07396 [Pyrenophora tritici-repentis]KAI0627194.1 hypothetical protein TUN199_00753 [Pyrenophora tritici-repentis]KAI2478774.1 hypothetical protein Ptr902_09740 [Pyrenophora tritici-repentis]
MKTTTFSSLSSVLLILSGAAQVNAQDTPRNIPAFQHPMIIHRGCCTKSHVWSSIQDTITKNEIWGWMVCCTDIFDKDPEGFRGCRHDTFFVGRMDLSTWIVAPNSPYAKCPDTTLGATRFIVDKPPT